MLKNIGRFFPIDAQGFIINDCDFNFITPPWTSLVHELILSCQVTWEKQIFGIYLRGSIPRGLGILGVSDLDSLLVLNRNITDCDRQFAKRLAETLQRRYLFCEKIEINLLAVAEITTPDLFWSAILKTQSLCIWGKDISSQLPPIKPGKALVLHSGDWEADLHQTLISLQSLSAHHLSFETQVKRQCRKIMRRMVRVGFELVMEQAGCYTRDLWLCYERFAADYPEAQWKMKTALELAITPSGNRAGLVIFLNQFGSWLTPQVQQFLSQV